MSFKLNPHLISIITPIYNAESFLPATLASITAQTYHHFEALLIVDKNSRDRSQEIAEQWALKDDRFKVILNTERGGVSANRNLGLLLAQGDYICFLDSDDLWLPHKLENQLHFMLKAHAEFSCHGFSKISESSSELNILVIPPEEITRDQLLHDNRIGCLSVMMKSSLAKPIQFRELMHEDMVFWLEALTRCEKVHGLREVLARYRVVKGSRSNNKWISAKGRWNILRNFEKMSLLKAIIYFAAYAQSALKKH